MEIRLKDGESFNIKGGDGLKVDGQPVGGSVEVVATLTKDGENPVKSKGIWSAIWGAIAAPAASVYEWVMTALDDKIDSNIDSKGRINLNEPIRLNAPLIVNTDKEGAGLFKGDTDNPYVSEGRASSIAGTLVNNAVDTHNNNFTAHQRLFSLVLSRYSFVNAAIVDGVVTIAPCTIATLESDGVAAFTVDVREGNGYARDCVLTVNCRGGSPSVIFDDTKFFPRGGDAANLEVVAGKRNVFFITEVQQNVFMVARDELALPNEGGGE